MRLAVAARNSEMRDAPGDPVVAKRMLLFAQFCEMTECLIVNQNGHFANLPGDSSHSYIADWLCPEIFTVDSPGDDKCDETSSFQAVFTIAPEAPCTRARELVASRHGDENWFYYEYVRDRTWTARDENTHEVENRPLALTNIILTVLWKPHGFHVVTRLPPGESFNASWFIDQNLVLLVHSFFPYGWSPKQGN
jgi:hypothetical protein